VTQPDTDSAQEHATGAGADADSRKGIWGTPAPTGPLQAKPRHVAGVVLLLGAQVATVPAAILGGMYLLGQTSGGV
jgi:hypothetical protein